MNERWRAVISAVAPVLGTALGGPLAGAAAQTIGRVLLQREDATQDQLEAAVYEASPEQLAALRAADQEFRAQMRALDIDVYRLEVADRAGARALYAVNYLPQLILSGVYVGGYFVTLGLLMRGVLQPPAELRETLQTLLATLGAVVMLIMQFWFGTSFGSREKTAALHASRPADAP